MAEEAKLVVALEASIKRFEKTLIDAGVIADKRTRDINKKFKAMNKAIEDSFSQIAAVATGSLGLLGRVVERLGPGGVVAATGLGAIVLALTAMSNAARKFGDDAIKVRNLAQTMGLTTTEIQAINDAGAEFAVTEDKMQTALGRLTSQLDEFRDGQGELFKIINQVDSGLARQIASTKDNSVALGLLIDAFGKMNDAAKSAAVARAAFGRGGFDVFLTLQNIATTQGGLRQLVKSFQDSGDAIDDSMIKEVARLKAEIDDMTEDAKRNLASIFSVQVLQTEHEFIEKFREFSREAKQFTLSDNLKLLLRVMSVSGLPLISGAAGLAASLIPDSDIKKIKDLEEEQKKLTQELEEWDQKFQAASDPRNVEDLTLAWEATRDRLREVTEELKKYKQSADEAAQTPVPAPGVPLPTARPSGLGQGAPSAKFELESYKKLIEILGPAATFSEQYRLEQLKLRAASEDVAGGQEAARRALAAFTVAQQEQILSARIALGVASEQEIIDVRRSAVMAKVAQGALTTAEAQRALALSTKEAKEQAEQLQVRLSNTPGLTQFALDAQNSTKALDQFAVRSLDTLGDGLAGIVTGTKTVSEAFKEMTASILQDLAKLIIKQSILGPLASALSGIIPGVSIPGRAMGGPVNAGQPYIVGEHGPELLVPRTNGQVIPNSVVRGSTGGLSVSYAPQYNVNGSGPEIDRLRSEIARDRAEFPARLAATYRDLRSRRVIH